MNARSLLAIVCCAFLPSCIAEIGDSGEAVDTAAEAAAKPECGTQIETYCEPLVSFELGKSKYLVHEMPKDATWHTDNSCLTQLRCAAAKDLVPGVYDRLYPQTLHVLSNPNVRFYEKGKSKFKKLSDVVNQKGEVVLGKLNRLVYWNDSQIAYDSMSQVDLGLWLLQVYRLHLERGDHARGYAFRDLGLAALGVITDEVKDGGLRTRKPCAKGADRWCSFFHSVTSRDQKKTNAGATLNKSLHPVRDLYSAANVLAEADPLDTTMSHGDRIQSLRKASLEGSYQLVYGKSTNGDGTPPNLFDFIPSASGKPIQNSWLYYGINAQTGEPHFLGNKGNDWKNCTYHMHVLDLLAVILPRVPEADRDGFTKPRAELKNQSVIGFILETYERKLEDGLEVDSATKNNGRFGKCAKGTDELDAKVLTALHAFE